MPGNKKGDKTTPIIMLTGKGESYDKIKGLDLGADDYISYRAVIRGATCFVGPLQPLEESAMLCYN